MNFLLRIPIDSPALQSRRIRETDDLIQIGEPVVLLVSHQWMFRFTSHTEPAPRARNGMSQIRMIDAACPFGHGAPPIKTSRKGAILRSNVSDCLRSSQTLPRHRVIPSRILPVQQHRQRPDSDSRPKGQMNQRQESRHNRRIPRPALLLQQSPTRSRGQRRAS